MKLLRNVLYRPAFLALAVAMVAPADISAQTASASHRGAAVAYPLKVSADRHYLVDQNGVPFLIVGDTPQGLMGRLNEKQAEFYFADREAHGFNTLGWIDVACAGHDYPTNTYATTPDGIRPFTGFVQGGSDYMHYDLSKPNEAYFARLDHMVQLATNHHLVVFLDPIETIGWLPVLRNNGMQAAYAYGQYLGKRYRHFRNVMWISGNDFNSWKVQTDDALAQAVAKGINSVAPEQLQTVELNVFTSSSLDDPTWIPLVSLNSTYTYSPTYMQMLHSYNQKPTTPAYLVEAHYDLENVGNPPDFGTPAVLRREEYWTMLTGGTGQFYGNKYTWSFADGWQGKIDTPEVEQLGIWKQFFASLPWQKLIPDQTHSILTGGFGTWGDFKTRVSQTDYVTAASTADKGVAVVYMPAARAITLNMSQLRGPARARWFDPSNGTYKAVAGSPVANTGSHTFTPPEKNHAGDGDWVLLLEASGHSAGAATASQQGHGGE